MIVPLLALALYAAAGVAVAVAFLVFGVTRVLPESAGHAAAPLCSRSALAAAYFFFPP